MSLAEMNEKNIMACDILSMFQLPMQDYSYSGISPTIKESDFDSSQRMVYFIPGRETKYVKVSE
jgi:hypothetical protein